MQRIVATMESRDSRPKHPTTTPAMIPAQAVKI